MNALLSSTPWTTIGEETFAGSCARLVSSFIPPPRALFACGGSASERLRYAWEIFASTPATWRLEFAEVDWHVDRLCVRLFMSKSDRINPLGSETGRLIKR